MNPTRELKLKMREPRPAISGDKITFDQDVEGRLVFANEPNVPAILRPGTKIRFDSPIIKIGAVLMPDLQGEGLYCNGDYISFKDGTIRIADIRGDNWFEVV